MELIWSRRAILDLQNIRKYIARHNPETAKEVAMQIAAAADSLLEFPQKGRVGRIYNTREWVISEWPYILVYKIQKKKVAILHVIHTSKNWP